MHVNRNCQPRCRTQRRPHVALLMLALASLAGVAHAVGFDEKLKAPMMKNAAELRTQAKAYAAKRNTVAEAAPVELITDAALARQQFDLKWQVERAVDERRSLKEMADVGVESNGDGSYTVDMNKHPEWNDLASAMTGILGAMNLDAWTSSLIDRGFRPEDVTLLREYVASHDATAAKRSAKLPLSLEFGRTVGEYDRLKNPVPDELVLSYIYQAKLVAAESDRAWLTGLLQQLDAQRGRILVSIFLEMGGQSGWAPTDTRAIVADNLANVRLPDFEARAIADAKGVAP